MGISAIAAAAILIMVMVAYAAYFPRFAILAMVARLQPVALWIAFCPAAIMLAIPSDRPPLACSVVLTRQYPKTFMAALCGVRA